MRRAKIEHRLASARGRKGAPGLGEEGFRLSRGRPVESGQTGAHDRAGRSAMKHYFSRNLNPRLAVAVARVLDSPVEFEFASPFSPEQREKFLKLNPNLSVPILVEGDKTLWEADAIACRLSQLANLTSGLWAIPFLTSSAGLPIEANRQLAADAGMVAEPLVNPSIEGWRTLLRENGLLWTSYGWQAMSPDGMTVQRAGRLIIIFYGKAMAAPAELRLGTLILLMAASTR
jgi:hypothetical protein